MASWSEWVYWLLSYDTWRGIVLGGLLVSFTLPALLHLLDWRRG